MKPVVPSTRTNTRARRTRQMPGKPAIDFGVTTVLEAAPGAALTDRRAVTLKGIPEPIEVATIAWKTN
jgi:hypothetical protein